MNVLSPPKGFIKFQSKGKINIHHNSQVSYSWLPWSEQRTWHGSEAYAGENLSWQDTKCTGSFMLFATMVLKAMAVKEMEPNCS